jgi:rubrerythrin
VERSSQMGTNRTGIDMSPFDSKAMTEASEKFFKTEGSAEALKTLKRNYARDAGTLGSVPVPGTPKGMFKSALKKMTGTNPEMFINKLGERLAYERSGVRVYESFIEKCEAVEAEGGLAPEISIEKLQQFRNEEAEHFRMLEACIEELGADPTAQTPDADVMGVASLGLMKVVSDPRTSISQSMEAMLSLELTDNVAWELLISLAEDMGMDEMAERFGHALHQENTHVSHIHEWYEKLVRSQSQMKLS